MKADDEIHIAYASDDIPARVSIAGYLVSLGGITVDVQADSGAELIEGLQALERLPDICILDVGISLKIDLKTLTEISARWPSLKFLVLSSFQSEHLVVPMLHSGVGGFLLKSCHPQEIKAALVEIHQNGYYYSKFTTDMLRRNVAALTEDELLLLRECCTDLTYTQIAAKLCRSPKSIEGYRESLFRKLGVKSRPALVRVAMQAGLIPIN